MNERKETIADRKYRELKRLVLVALLTWMSIGIYQCIPIAHADDTSRNTRALERIARALEGKCK